MTVVNVGEMAATIGNGGNDTWWEGWEKVCATPSNTNNYRSSQFMDKFSQNGW